ncbi:segregation and condensation protein A [Desulfohalotomaculum tongense]|uniref:segregation and condensation protein A n=1 Tax=Desulforadius tongensis TaxID=1216062 RepID=UPI00195C81A4|nr:segregation/condensation protein A [Desulforadius tongensis]MBM7854682.1 segregation and condensation protein A [Desulforadius tongensis]
MAYTVRLPAFEGPLDLLLHLIEKNQLEIENIPIASITAQYLEYLDTMKELDLEVTSEFLVMASTLLAIKARTLLPKPKPDNEGQEEEGPDPREELVQRLLEYKRFKEAAVFLKERQQVHGRVYTRPNSIEMYQSLLPCPEPLAGVDMPKLLDALRQVLKRAVKVEPPKVRAAEIRVQDKMAQVTRKLVLYPKGMPFTSAFSKNASRGEIVVTFLAILELLRLRQVELIQNGHFAEIIILPAKGDNSEHDGTVS